MVDNLNERLMSAAMLARDYAQTALDMARANGRRVDCLRVSVDALNGALRNLCFEQEAARKAAKEERRNRPAVATSGWTGRDCQTCDGCGENDEARACGACGGTGEEYVSDGSAIAEDRA